MRIEFGFVSMYLLRLPLIKKKKKDLFSKKDNCNMIC